MHFDWERQSRIRNTSAEDGESVQFTECVGPIDVLIGRRALIVMGAPGVGKSTALKDIESRELEEGTTVLHVDLKGLADWADVQREVFDTSKVQEWRARNGHLMLILDSLDECQVRAATLGSRLGRTLSTLIGTPPEENRLRVVFGCRSVVWREAFGELRGALLKLFGEVSEAELLPLSSGDVMLAATQSGVDVPGFMEELREARAEELVTQPLHLIMLLRQFERGDLPLTRDLVELQERSALRSCEEWDRDRGHPAEKLGSLERLEVASRVAAFLMLCQRRAVTLLPDTGRLPEHVLRVSDLAGGQETVRGVSFDVLEREVRETLRTQLFREDGAGDVDVWHASVKEYLTARYLRRFPPGRAVALLGHPDDPEERVVPQLREVAGWLARLSPEVSALLMEREPEVVLRAGVSLSPAELTVVVEKLLRNEVTLGGIPHVIERPERLMAAGLRELLGPVLIDRERPFRERDVAFALVKAVHIPSFLPELQQVVENREEEPRIRQRAAQFITSWGESPGAVHHLAGLLCVPGWSDPGDLVRGAVLRGGWPGILSTEELLGLLTPPSDTVSLSLYRYFLSSETTWASLPPEGVPRVLMWLTRPATWDWAARELNTTGLSALMQMGWPRREEQGVSEALICILDVLLHDRTLSRLALDKAWFSHALREDEEVRRWCLRQYVAMERAHRRKRSLRNGELLTPRDALWVLERIEQAAEVEERLRWLEVLRIDGEDRPVFERYWDVKERFPEVAERTTQDFEVSLKAEETQWKRQDYQTTQVEILQQRRLQEILGRATPHPRGWLKLLAALYHMNARMEFGVYWTKDVLSFSGWVGASQELRLTILDVAEAFIRELSGEEGTWMGIGIPSPVELAGYQALALLGAERPGVLDRLQQEAWRRWAPIILLYPNLGGGSEIDRGLQQRAYREAQGQCLEVMRQWVEHHGAEDTLDIPDRWFLLQDEPMREAFRHVLRSPATPQVYRHVLLKLVAWGDETAKETAKETLTQVESVEDQDTAVEAAVTLFRVSSRDSWEQVWAFVKDHPLLGLKVWERVALREASVDWLEASAVVEIYDWLHQYFPQEEDAPIPTEGFYTVSPRHSVQQFRDRLLPQLMHRGTADAVRALQELSGRDLSLVWAYREALEAFRRLNWEALVPAELMKMIAQPQLRLVRSSGELLAVIVESLRRLAEVMQGETPLAPLLWNELPGKSRRPEDVTWTPKGEERFSDLIRWHLGLDLARMGLILNREVQIRSPQGKAKGQRTDILVEAKVTGPLGEMSIGVIIEVKGQWNRELMTSLQSQLVDQYLRDNPGRAGLYLVGYFNCVQWSFRDYRRRTNSREAASMDSLQIELDSQAHRCSTTEYPVRAFVLNMSLRHVQGATTDSNTRPLRFR